MGYLAANGFGQTVTGTLPGAPPPPPQTSITLPGGYPPPTGGVLPSTGMSTYSFPGMQPSQQLGVTLMNTPGGSPGYPASAPATSQLGISSAPTIDPGIFGSNPIVVTITQTNPTLASNPMSDVLAFMELALGAFVINKRLMTSPGDMNALYADIDAVSQFVAWMSSPPLAGAADLPIAKVFQSITYVYFFPMLYRYMMSATTYAKLTKNRANGLDLYGRRPLKAGMVSGMVVRNPTAPGTPGVPPPAAPAAGSSNTMLVLGALALAGGAYVLLA